MAQPNSEKGAPLARWIQRCPERESDLIVHVSPLEIGWRLDQLLWSRAAGVCLLSATLRALNSFSYFCRQVGLEENDGTQFLALPSPFNYQENARLVIPLCHVNLKIRSLPRYCLKSCSSTLKAKKPVLYCFLHIGK